MDPEPLRYVPYAESADLPNVVVDGSPNAGTVLTISHWPGLPMPAGCEADTSAQMVFRYLERGAGSHAGATAVTNNHFDQDGLAAMYALAAPEDALRRRQQLEALATAGDFAVARDRASARLSMAVAALGDPERSPLADLPSDYDDRCAVLYAAALELLPQWLDDVDVCRDLWAAEDDELDRAIQAMTSSEVSIEEDVQLDLAVVGLGAAGRSTGHRFVGRRFDVVHPMALHAATERSVILLLDPAGGRHELTCRYEGWVQFQSRPIRRRVDLRPLADELTGREPDGASWLATAPSDLAPQLRTDPDGPPSALDPRDLDAAVRRHLRTAPAAWNPYELA